MISLRMAVWKLSNLITFKCSLRTVKRVRINHLKAAIRKACLSVSLNIRIPQCYVHHCVSKSRKPLAKRPCNGLIWLQTVLKCTIGALNKLRTTIIHSSASVRSRTSFIESYRQKFCDDTSRGPPVNTRVDGWNLLSAVTEVRIAFCQKTITRFAISLVRRIIARLGESTTTSIR